MLIARAQIEYIHILGKKIIVSGIDKKEQLDLMKELGRDHIQGDIISPPLDMEGVINNFLRDNHIYP